MRYYVISDVHGYYTQMKSALEKAGFFSDTTPHKLIMLGDLFDRGHEAKQLQQFILEGCRIAITNQTELMILHSS